MHTVVERSRHIQGWGAHMNWNRLKHLSLKTRQLLCPTVSCLGLASIAPFLPRKQPCGGNAQHLRKSFVTSFPCNSILLWFPRRTYFDRFTRCWGLHIRSFATLQLFGVSHTNESHVSTWLHKGCNVNRVYALKWQEWQNIGANSWYLLCNVGGDFGCATLCPHNQGNVS